MGKYKRKTNKNGIWTDVYLTFLTASKFSCIPGSVKTLKASKFKAGTNYFADVPKHIN